MNTRNREPMVVQMNMDLDLQRGPSRIGDMYKTCKAGCQSHRELLSYRCTCCSARRGL